MTTLYKISAAIKGGAVLTEYLAAESFSEARTKHMMIYPERVIKMISVARKGDENEKR